MSDRRNPLFLGRGSYRQRRLADAARALPLVGAVMMMLPLVWPRAEEAETITTSGAMIYVFGCWLLLVFAAQALARRLDPAVTETHGDDDPARGG